MKKTISFAILHFGVAFTVAYLLTGELLTASLIALIEPAVNTVAFYFHDLGWHKFKPNHSLQAKTSSFALVHFSGRLRGCLPAERRAAHRRRDGGDRTGHQYRGVLLPRAAVA